MTVEMQQALEREMMDARRIELFIPMMQAAKTALGVDDATIQAVLAAAEM